eukprot:CAMPEP_0119314084 /NCGR_PEP_ID=MMETSP1333-20130426/31607_1 /TAXON_ID=418940 /ORGANISM="Scyphosphaera apsteinii, Strain RCC1455" /LENGTH=456 /DNA_ID=CAMNT_0007319127 /DNA_START=49 /DNA_END=1419 /DNA_ORIENTATION=+
MGAVSPTQSHSDSQDDDDEDDSFKSSCPTFKQQSPAPARPSRVPTPEAAPSPLPITAAIAGTHNIQLEDSQRPTLAAFDVLGELGFGASSEVVLVKEKDTGKLFAMKVISKTYPQTKKQLDHVLAENEIMRQVQHPFIVQLAFSFQDDLNFYLVLTYAGKGSLDKVICNCIETGTPLDEGAVLLILAEVVSATSYLHSCSIMHRDIKPENILVGMDGHILLADFGGGKMNMPLWLDCDHTPCGTVEYMAPEVISGKYGTSANWWSIGVITFELLTLRLPFYEDATVNLRGALRHIVLLQKIRKHPEEFRPDVHGVSPQMSKFVRELLRVEPAKRLGASGVDEVSAHRLFASMDWNELYNKKLPPPLLASSWRRETPTPKPSMVKSFVKERCHRFLDFACSSSSARKTSKEGEETSRFSKKPNSRFNKEPNSRFNNEPNESLFGTVLMAAAPYSNTR